jgi:enoyl-CoA hydratase/carnithine racemase
MMENVVSTSKLYKHYNQVQARMSEHRVPSFIHISVERRGQIFIITLRRGEENRLNTSLCNEVIKAFHYIQRALGPDAAGAVITQGHDAKFWCTGVDQDERDSNPYANSDGFFPMVHTILDFPYPTIALLTGHTFGGACPFALSHDYRIMNSERGFISMVCSPTILLRGLC